MNLIESQVLKLYGTYGMIDTMVHKETYDKLREYFVNSNCTLEELANISKKVAGQQVSIDSLKDRARRDPVGTWEVLRAARRSAETKGDIPLEIETIRRLLFTQIAHSSLSGVFIYGNVNLGDVRKAVEGIEGIEGCEQINPRLDSSIVNAYMNLLQKSQKGGLSKGTSGKTTLQQTIEMVKRAQEQTLDLESQEKDLDD
jgi:hypothetical protein